MLCYLLTIKKLITIVTNSLPVHTSTGRYPARATLHVTTHYLLSVELKVFQLHVLIHWSFWAIRFVTALHRTSKVALDLSRSSPMALSLVIIAIALTALVFVGRRIWLWVPCHNSCVLMVWVLNHHFWYSILSDTLSYIIYFFWVLCILMLWRLTIE